MPRAIQIARLLRAGTTGFVAGCRINQINAPSFGALVAAPLDGSHQVFGLIHDIRIDDDGLVRQLVASEHVSDEVIRDNRERRIVPVEIAVLSVGYESEGHIYHGLPPRPPLSLDMVYLCEDSDLVRFSSTGSLGYFRHILQAKDVPAAEVLAAHVRQASAAHKDGGQWQAAAIREIIALLRDDYHMLISVMGALNEAV